MHDTLKSTVQYQAHTQTSASGKKPEKTVLPSRLVNLLGLERAALACPDRRALKYLAVTKTRTLADYNHAFFITQTLQGWSFQAISSQSVIDQNAPFLQWLSKELTRHAGTQDFDQPCEFLLSPEGATDKMDDFDYPFPNALWAPFAPDPKLGGILFTRSSPWTAEETSLLGHISAQYGCCWVALGQARRKETGKRRKKWLLAGTACALLIFFFPVSITTLAPAEIIAKQPDIVSAPIDGIIEKFYVPPNSWVQKGDHLASFTDTAYRNDYKLAEEELRVAEARLRQISLSAHLDANTKRELTIASAERDLAGAKRDYAVENLEKIEIYAKKDGLLIYTDEDDWKGRPVNTGERIMEIADPQQITLRIEAPVADNEILEAGARVRFFLDANPLKPVSARLTSASYYATPQPGGTLAYLALANIEDATRLPRIGTRGVAKIYGGKAPFGYWLLRRPIASIRQFFGL